MQRKSAYGWSIVLCLAALAWPGDVLAQTPKFEDLLTFEVRVQPEDPFDHRVETKFAGPWKARRGEVVRIEFHGKLKDGWNTYPISQRTSEQHESQFTKWTLDKQPGITPLWPLRESEPKVATIDYGKSKETSFKVIKNFTWSQDVLVATDAAPGTLDIRIKLDMQICQNTCIPFDNVIVPVKIDVSDEEPLPLSAAVLERVNAAKPNVTIVPIESLGQTRTKSAPTPASAPGAKNEGGSIIADALIKGSHEDYKSAMEAIAAQIEGRDASNKDDAGTDLLGFILAGIFWGAISLVTPCVFPMIPITVSFFIKQSEKQHHRPLAMASVYSLTIIIVLTLAAAFLLTAFQKLSVHPLMNYFIGGLFIFFALSLFGMYEIELPQSLAQYTSSREGQGGLVGTIFMALTFTIISFACVAPFLGGFGGTAASQRPLWHNLIGGFAFAGTFAASFFLLALFPAVIRKLPKSGSWMNSVKVVMAFLELAAALKFFRKAELVQTAGAPSFFTFDLVLGLWIAMSILCALYLIGVFRLPHDTPEENIKVPRLILSVAFLGLGLYLMPALFKVNAAGQPQRPVGTVYSWIDAFLLPDSHAGDTEIAHSANLPYAIAQARAEFQRTGTPKRIFIDFTGVTCDNCKLNEKSVFPKPEIHNLFAPYLFVKLFTDSVPLDYYAPEIRADASAAQRSIDDAKQVNLIFSGRAFKSTQLPLYVVIEPQLDNTIRVLGIYPEGHIKKENEFAEFLKNPAGK